MLRPVVGERGDTPGRPATEAGLTRNVYRFLPPRYRPEDVRRYHGVDERISVENYAQCVRVYHPLIRNSAQ